MGQPYIGEIRMYAGTFAPLHWMFCHGQDLPIWQYEQLFDLIGTTYGGDGRDTFRLPNFMGRVPVHFGNDPEQGDYRLGELGGTEEVYLATRHLPDHTHAFRASGDPGTSKDPENQMLALSGGPKLYREGATPNAPLAPNAVYPEGGSQAHANLMPYLCVNYIIALAGIYPNPA